MMASIAMESGVKFESRVYSIYTAAYTLLNNGFLEKFRCENLCGEGINP